MENAKSLGKSGSRVELDPVGQFYAATISDDCPGTFRISARLNERVNPEALREAVGDLIRRRTFAARVFSPFHRDMWAASANRTGKRRSGVRVLPQKRARQFAEGVSQRNGLYNRDHAHRL